MERRDFLRPLLAVVLGGIPKMQVADLNDADSIEEIKKEVLKVKDDMHRAPLYHDRATLERIYADDLVWIPPTGEILTKAQLLALQFPEKPKPYSVIKAEDTRLHVYGSTVIITEYANDKPNYDSGNVYSTARRRIWIFIKQGGQWQLVAHQGTVIAKP